MRWVVNFELSPPPKSQPSQNSYPPWGDSLSDSTVGVPDIIVISYSVIFSVDAEVILLYHCRRNYHPPSYVSLFSLGSAEMIFSINFCFDTSALCSALCLISPRYSFRSLYALVGCIDRYARQLNIGNRTPRSGRIGTAF